MINIDVFRVRDIEVRLGQFRNKARTVIVRALNRAIENARTNVVKKTREEYYVKASDIRGTIKLEKATPDSLRAIVRAKDTRRELINFNVRPGKPKPKKPPILRVAIKKGSGFVNFAGAFLARGTSTGKLHVLKRVTESRYPIHIKYGIAIPQMIGHPRVKVYVEEQAREIFKKRVDHEINRLLGGGG